MKNKILVPTDFSPVAESALLHGMELAQSLHCSICLLHVYNTPTGTIFNKEDPACLEALRNLKEYQTRYQDRYSVQIEPLIREGNLFKIVNTVVAAVKPRLMVMGTHGKQGLQQLFGSHALRVVLDASCPVMVVQEPPAEPGYRRILLPVNLEVDPVQLIEWVLLLYHLAQSEIHLYQAFESIPDRAKQTERITSRIMGMCQEKNISCTLSAANSPSDFSCQVIAHACACRSDLVLTMTMPAAAATGFSFSDWNERLMFNPERIPVMFIDQAEAAG